MSNFSNKRRMAKIPDVSNQKVYEISQENGGNRIASLLVPDQETVNLINWLAQEQGISPEHALKRAVATAAYIHDLTENEKGTLLVLLKDGSSIRKILLK
jgi:hypothetical protein